MKKITFYLLLAILTIDCANSINKEAAKPDISEAKDAFCYLKAEGAQMYVQPDQGSTQLWIFSKGEVLAVLDSKMEANKSWLQVKFRGFVKAGYEEMVEITGEPSNPIGWIQGTVEELVSCK